MKVGDPVDVYIDTGEYVGPGKITQIGAPTVRVIVERPRGGPYEFGAPQSDFQQIGPDRWRLNTPSTTRSVFLLEEENGQTGP